MKKNKITMKQILQHFELDIDEEFTSIQAFISKATDQNTNTQYIGGGVTRASDILRTILIMCKNQLFREELDGVAIDYDDEDLLEFLYTVLNAMVQTYVTTNGDTKKLKEGFIN